MKEMGIVQCALSAAERDVGPPYDFPDALQKLGPGEINRPLPWSELTDEQRAFQAAKMAMHAAMVDRMDQEIGQIVQQLREMGAFENTLILLPVRQRRECRDHGARRRPRSPGPARIGRLVLVSGAGLVDLREHAVPPAQDVGA